MRFKDTPNLFGCGAGVSTIAPFKCDLCKKIYNKNNEDEDGYIIDMDAPPICYTSFAGMEICEYCFEVAENSVLCRISDILSWYKEILDAEERDLKNKRQLLDNTTAPKDN